MSCVPAITPPELPGIVAGIKLEIVNNGGAVVEMAAPA
jgi:hypothetical protein